MPLSDSQKSALRGAAAKLRGEPAPDPTEGTAAGPGTQDGIPAFVKDVVPAENIHEVAAPKEIIGNAEVVSDVDPANDTQINVRDAAAYTPDVRAHEATHVAQFVRKDGVEPNLASGEKLATNADEYGYGDLDAQRAKGQTMANMSQEQQARIVGDYVKGQRAIEAKEKAGTATDADRAAYSKMQATYHPWVRDLVKQPEGNAINTTPERPGLPSADTPGLGMLAPDKLMGGGYVRDGSDFMATPNAKGLVERGNLPIWDRPRVQNADGSHSSEYSVSFQDDKGHEVLVPTVVNGKFLTPNGKKPPEGSPQEKLMFKTAWQHYKQTGEHLGKFDNPDDADAYAQVLHNRGDKPAAGTSQTSGPIHQQGSGGLLNAKTAAQYLSKAGGDKQKARAFAAHDGWRF